ncbi:MAG: hypothetical protein HY922_01510 [Elusimicrobia bacterium]|nr:hypothetical protein [Elusimicrobiota bacterium]
MERKEQLLSALFAFYLQRCKCFLKKARHLQHNFFSKSPSFPEVTWAETESVKKVFIRPTGG